ncbi:hypothetical protein CDD81_7112 [Ophiocordyceps australis]|uniref:COP9 signalosome complex subunit 3 N-terminal helical repeats domain-containing protein n=1 Tax=Ophiocordyceps australis TaxID=1399860 RepID=A0A2C5XYX8_9HYPO|nr:hypothetical protein CDD81_7112 [Ophiocordyceps australis]
MEALHKTLERCPSPEDYGTNYALLHSALKDYAQSIFYMPKATQGLIDENALAILKLLDPSQDTLAFLFVINIALAQKEVSKEVLDKVVLFLCSFDVCQVRYAGAAFSALLTKIASESLFPPVVTINLLVEAMVRLEPSGTMFTNLHLPLAKLVYDCGDFDLAARVLDSDILFYPSTANTKESRPLCEPGLPPYVFMSTKTGLTSLVTASVVLEYNLVRSLIYISAHDWAKAYSALEQIVTHPCKDKSVSKIMIDAHKRWLLVSLLHTGKNPDSPPITSRSALNVYHNKNRPYLVVADHFDTDNVIQFADACQEHTQMWRADATESLIDQVMMAYQKWRIINLKNIYVCLSLSQVRRATLDAVTRQPLPTNAALVVMLQEMVDSGMLKAIIAPEENDPDTEGSLLFTQSSQWSSEKEFGDTISRTVQSIKDLGQQYRLVDERLSSNADYVRHLAHNKKRSESEKELDPTLGFESQVEDEDLMTGIVVHS